MVLLMYSQPTSSVSSGNNSSVLSQGIWVPKNRPNNNFTQLTHLLKSAISDGNTKSVGHSEKAIVSRKDQEKKGAGSIETAGSNVIAVSFIL